MNQSFAYLKKQPWVWSFAAALAVWLITIAYTEGQGATAILTAALSFATFTIIVGLGQMMVITTGPGNVDLSIPATITLSGVVAMKVMDEQTAMIIPGIFAALGAATLVGIFNYGLIRLLRIPPIIATLSSSFLILSTAISYARGIRNYLESDLGLLDGHHGVFQADRGIFHLCLALHLLRVQLRGHGALCRRVQPRDRQ